MGFLDHTTNNVVIDAVLTERGRELLSQNGGNFSISSFSFGDDEVDYTNIKKYGLQMGKEKIEKNTPIFEAQTNENLALKYNNITLNNNNLRILYIPVLKRWSGSAGSVSNIVELDINDVNKKYATVYVLSTLNQSSGQTTIDSNLRDDFFTIKMNNLILKQYQTSGTEIVQGYDDLDENNIATYSQLTSSNASDTSYESGYALTGRKLFTFAIGLSMTSPQINLSTFQKFGTIVSGRYIIKTQLEVSGTSSGSRIIIPVNITGPTV
jgi:hypothetical protein